MADLVARLNSTEIQLIALSILVQRGKFLAVGTLLGKFDIPRCATRQHSVQSGASREYIRLLVEYRNSSLVGVIERIDIGGIEAGCSVGTLRDVAQIYQFGLIVVHAVEYDIGWVQIVVTQHRNTTMQILQCLENTPENLDSDILLKLTLLTYLIGKQHSVEIVGYIVLTICATYLYFARFDATHNIFVAELLRKLNLSHPLGLRVDKMLRNTVKHKEFEEADNSLLTLHTIGLGVDF